MREGRGVGSAVSDRAAVRVKHEASELAGAALAVLERIEHPAHEARDRRVVERHRDVEALGLPRERRLARRPLVRLCQTLRERAAASKVECRVQVRREHLHRRVVWLADRQQRRQQALELGLRAEELRQCLDAVLVHDERQTQSAVGRRRKRLPRSERRHGISDMPIHRVVHDRVALRARQQRGAQRHVGHDAKVAVAAAL